MILLYFLLKSHHHHVWLVFNFFLNSSSCCFLDSWRVFDWAAFARTAFCWTTLSWTSFLFSWGRSWSMIHDFLCRNTCSHWPSNFCLATATFCRTFASLLIHLSGSLLLISYFLFGRDNLAHELLILTIGRLVVGSGLHRRLGLGIVKDYSSRGLRCTFCQQMWHLISLAQVEANCTRIFMEQVLIHIFWLLLMLRYDWLSLLLIHLNCLILWIIIRRTQVPDTRHTRVHRSLLVLVLRRGICEVAYFFTPFCKLIPELIYFTLLSLNLSSALGRHLCHFVGR